MNAIPYGLATLADCTVRTGHIIDDGFKSFPSGHSSCTFALALNARETDEDAWRIVSFAGLGFLSFYLAGKMNLYDRGGFAVRCSFAVPAFVQCY